MEDRRKDERFNVSFTVGCEDLSNHHYFYTVSKDLSTNGMKIITNYFLPRGNTLKINLYLIDKVVNLKAKVIWSNKERYCDRYYAGLFLTEISEGDKPYILEFLNSARKLA
ncbi:MAG: PilZ domain-containing protein [Candidatus Omnitrophica bacterium]|nr:PilZ domain-containing protein [Candidatus Omnitrophota bacterium]MCM8826129.1 PilZ domain-containing protein [Candidatus Omnitrophota bacterium]